MNHRSLILRAALAALLLSFTACGKQPAKTAAAPGTPPPAASAVPGIESVDQKVSYGIGYNMGSSLGREKMVQVDKAAFLAGIEDGLAGAKTRIPDAEIEAAFTAMQQKVSTEMAAAAEKQLAACNDFLAKNKAKTGVTVTASGLQYEVLKSGTGPKPKTTDTVKVHYHGTLMDGTVFDSSVERNEPIEFAVTGVIPGWVEALQLMSVGDKWKLTIPPAIAYGPRATGKIPANSVLIFEVELLGIK
ncbi:MAG: FKBP-type peptidyl-prolyl cis-trans isomerase [Lacunisphaera sp.]|nr:FKBP-type peptidyl-prolyl cis-trans isomerase [Lacunisphaera sp.]